MPGGFFGYGRGSGVIPGVRSSPQGSTDSVVKGIMAGIRGPQMRAARSAAIGEGIRRFESIGTEESMRIAQLMGENPQGAAMYADTFGGWEKLYNQQKSNALQGQAARMRAGAVSSLRESPDQVPWAPGMQPGAGSASSSEDYYRALLEAGFPPEQAAEMAQSVADLQKTQSETAENLRPAARPGGAWKNVLNPETGEMEQRYIYPGETGAPTGQNAFSMTTPDGTVVSYGPQGPGGATALEKKSIGKTQGEIITADDALARIGHIRDTYEESGLKYTSQLKDWARTKAWKLDFLDIDQETAGKMSDRAVFRASALDNINRVIKEITGAQMNKDEAARIIPTQPNLDVSGPVFHALLENVQGQIEDYRDRRVYLLNTGQIDVGHDFDRNGTPMSVEAFKRKHNRRGDQIAESLREDNPNASPAAIDEAVLAQLEAERGQGVRW